MLFDDVKSARTKFEWEKRRAERKQTTRENKNKKKWGQMTIKLTRNEMTKSKKKEMFYVRIERKKARKRIY